jgi:hypothetical protein
MDRVGTCPPGVIRFMPAYADRPNPAQHERREGAPARTRARPHSRTSPKLPMSRYGPAA